MFEFNDFVAPSLYPAAPEIFILAMACVILLVDLVVKSPRKTLTFGLTQMTLLGCALITLLTGTGTRTLTFSGMFVDDMMSDFLKLMVYLSVSFVLFYSREYIQARKAIPRGEYYVLALLATLGMMVMISANHFLTLYLGLEIMSISLYAMVALNRDSAVSTEASMKYFILGALASGLLLYGISMIFGVTGQLQLDLIAPHLPELAAATPIMVFGLVFLVAGLAFKLGVVPFHMWVPDVYQGAPTSVTLFIATAPKIAAFAILIRLLVVGLFPLAMEWQSMLMVLSVLSLAIGNMVAIAQTNIKRMLGYSAISHMGFMLLGMVAGFVSMEASYDVATNAYSSAMFYVVTYVLTSMAAFGVILHLSRPGFESDKLEDFKGLNKRNPWFAAVMMVVMFSMAGIPFFVGFFAKFSVLQVLISGGSKYYWLAIAAVLFSLIGAFYYLRVVKLMYFDEPLITEPIQSSTLIRGLLSVNGIAVVALGLFPGFLMLICERSIELLLRGL